MLQWMTRFIGRSLPKLAAAALLGLCPADLAAGAGAGTAAPSLGAAPQQQAPANAPLVLKDALPQEAFAALGRRHGAEFRLAEGEWIGAEAGVRVNADLSEASFWRAMLTLSEQTSYEPMFRPYGRSDEGQPILWLRRVDVPGEEQVAPAIAAGSLLLRATEARVTIDLKMAQLRLVAPQAAVRVEVFLEPNVSATYVTAAALRAWDEEEAQLKRGQGHDPTTGFEEGLAELWLHLDVTQRIPTQIAKWQALMRVVEATQTQTLEAPLKCISEVRRHGLVARPEGQGPRISTQPATVPAPVPVDVHVLGPYEMRVEAVRLGQRELDEAALAAGEEPSRIATLQLTVPRGAMDHTAWSRLYGFLVASSPEIRHNDATGESAGRWRMLGYAVVATPSEAEPQVAGTFRVWAQFEAPPGTPDPAVVSWELPVESEEQQHRVIWENPLEIKPPASQGTTRPQGRRLGDLEG